VELQSVSYSPQATLNEITNIQVYTCLGFAVISWSLPTYAGLNVQRRHARYRAPIGFAFGTLKKKYRKSERWNHWILVSVLMGTGRATKSGTCPPPNGNKEGRIPNINTKFNMIQIYYFMLNTLR
jgi:hypothetical protein